MGRRRKTAWIQPVIGDQLWPKAAAVATHEIDVLDEVTERRLLTRNLRTLNA